MVVDHPRRLHVSVYHRRADKFKTILFHRLTDGVRLASCSRQLLQCLPAIDDGFAPDKSPEIRGERPVLLAHREELTRVRNSCLYFEAVTDDARVAQEPSHIRLAVARYFFGIESMERLPEILTLVQHTTPAQARLHGLEDEEF